MREFVGVILLVVLVLAGALLPLRYTARLNLPEKRRDTGGRETADETPVDRGL